MKTDIKRSLGSLYRARQGVFETVVVPRLNFIMIDGKGYPGTSQEYIDAIQTLYPVAYTIKFMCKQELDQDYTVMPLEGLWWAEDMGDFLTGNKERWQWTAMIMQPDEVTEDIFLRAVDQAKAKKNPPAINKLRFERYDEGRAAQVLYIGPYSGEGPTIRKMHEYIAAEGGELTAANKHHHEIYLSDTRRTDESKLKTIIRQPY